MVHDHPDNLSYSVYAALFAGLITAGAYISLPLPFSPVPVALQSLFVLVAGILLPPRWALASVGLYLVLGAIGLPVFSAARGGLAHFAGPTGGYLLGFLPAAWVCAMLAGAGPGSQANAGGNRAVESARDGAACALAAGVLPFIPGDAAKVVAAVVIARIVRRIAGRSSTTLIWPLKRVSFALSLVETARERHFLRDAPLDWSGRRRVAWSPKVPGPRWYSRRLAARSSGRQ